MRRARLAPGWSTIALQKPDTGAEGKEYIETILKGVGRSDVRVTFGDGVKDKRIANFQVAMLEIQSKIYK